MDGKTHKHTRVDFTTSGNSNQVKHRLLAEFSAREFRVNELPDGIILTVSTKRFCYAGSWPLSSSQGLF